MYEMEKRVVYRHEYKFIINAAQQAEIRRRLACVAKLDTHATPNGTYLIRSLYFDDLFDRVLAEKKDGADCRTKFRLRCYNGDLSFLLLEKKSKRNGMSRKQSCRITQEECRRLLAGDSSWLLQDPERVPAPQLYAAMQTELLKPRTVVEYIREPYVYEPGNVRITFDRCVRTGLQATDFLNPQLPTVAVTSGRTCVLEVKYDDFLPEIIAWAMAPIGQLRTSFSKYEACRIYG
ncbi:MAG: polyphosphate polymerase domain-containing protein [Clostridia bacterium]|nr:polyphosphate polymerase domain-containing protein [Clostridia bacterium]